MRTPSRIARKTPIVTVTDQPAPGPDAGARSRAVRARGPVGYCRAVRRAAHRRAQDLVRRCWRNWWCRTTTARTEARTSSSHGRRPESRHDNRGDAADLGHDRGDRQCVDHLPQLTDLVAFGPVAIVWVRLIRGSQWHRAGAACAPRAGEMMEFRGAMPPRAGGFVVCLECAFVTGIGVEAAAYPARHRAEPAHEPATATTMPFHVENPRQSSRERPTSPIPRLPGDSITARPAQVITPRPDFGRHGECA